MSRKRFDLRTYLAGGAAMSSLIVACAIVFTSLAAYVGFNGLPIAGTGPDRSGVVIATDRAAGADRDRAAAPPQGAQRREASAGSRGRTARATPGAERGAEHAAGNAAAAAAGEVGAGGAQVVSQTGGGSTQTAAPAPAPAPAPASSPEPVESLAAEGSGPVQQLVDQVSQQTSIPLDDLTSGITAPVRDALGQLRQQIAGNEGPNGLLDGGD